MTMATSLLSSGENYGAGHCSSPREEEVCPCGSEKERGLAVVTFLPSSVESCGGGHGLCHQLLEKRVCPSSPKKERVMTVATSLLSSVESYGAGH